MQAALSKYEDNEFVNDRYEKIEERLKVGGAWKAFDTLWGSCVLHNMRLPCPRGG